MLCLTHGIPDTLPRTEPKRVGPGIEAWNLEPNPEPWNRTSHPEPPNPEPVRSFT
jgi:hypothetical protein